MTGLLKAFIAGFISTLVFHQGTLAILHAAGLTARGPYVATSTWPLHVPAFVSLAFWGGVWALALVLGAVLPSVVAWFVVFPLTGAPIAGGWAPGILALSLMLNGAWGFGVALLLRATKH